MRSFLFALSFTILCSTHLFSDHGTATWGKLKYGADFKHFDYVNPNAPQDGDVTHGALGTFDSINAHIVKGTPAIGVGETIATLLAPSYDEINAAYGYVAQDVSVSADKLKVTFTLNPNATFSDNTKITAADVVFSFNILRKHGLPMIRSYYKDVVKADTEGESKVVFTLKDTKNKELPVILGQLPVFSKAYYSKHKFQETTLTPAPSSGPYVIENVDPGRSITLAKRENWWGQNLPSQKGSHNFKRIKYVYYRDMNAMFEAFKSGQIDIRLENTARAWFTGYDFSAVKDGRVIKDSITHKMCSGTYGCAFNTRRDIFKNRDVRKALTILFDFAWANKTLFFENYKRNESYFPNSDFVTEGPLSTEDEEVLKKLGLDKASDDLKKPFNLPVFTSEDDKRKTVEEALSILKTQGYEIKNQKLVDKKGKQLAFEILVYDKALERPLSNYIETLKRIGVDAKIREVDTSTYQLRVDECDFDMMMYILPQSNSPGNELRDYFGSHDIHAKGTRNYAGIKDPVIDGLIDLIISSADFPQLRKSMRLLDRVLLDGYYIIPAWHQNTVNIAYWNKFARPKVAPPYNPIAFDTWWVTGTSAEKKGEESNTVSKEAPSKESPLKETSSWYDSIKSFIKGLFHKAP